MQNDVDQINQKDPNNRGLIGFEHISPELCSTWLSIKNDYGILIGADKLDSVENVEDEDEEGEWRIKDYCVKQLTS